MTIFVKIMVKPELPEQSVQVVPHITPAFMTDPAGVLRAIEHPHKVIYCGSRETGEQVREMVARTEDIEEMPKP